ncbi:hypothetical protein GCM10023231_12960 [Olivibacter ginsenosidimutans]|uniref:Uncharacterized protein n=1 Tax=Olivibacter ginsenosidimutans TaxID=1176537 RepID=A0ABP9AVA0_9SPHI
MLFYAATSIGNANHILNTFKGKTKYGQGFYDFEEGRLEFLKPLQMVVAPENTKGYAGFVLYFHPDFIRNYPLG